MLFMSGKLKEWRVEIGLTQEEAAKKARITQAYWYSLETGRRIPSLEVLDVLSDITGIKKSVLLGEHENPPLPSTPNEPPATGERAKKIA